MLYIFRLLKWFNVLYSVAVYRNWGEEGKIKAETPIANLTRNPQQSPSLISHYCPFLPCYVELFASHKALFLLFIQPDLLPYLHVQIITVFQDSFKCYTFYDTFLIYSSKIHLSLKLPKFCLYLLLVIITL